MTDPIKDALRAAARQFCICDGECYETRRGMMNGPCEAMLGQAAAAVAAFLRALPGYYVMQAHSQPPVPGGIGNGSLHTIAAAVEKAARDE